MADGVVSSRLGWRPAAFNAGWAHHDRVQSHGEGEWLSQWMANRHQHSATAVWLERIAAGELHRNGEPLGGDMQLASGDDICWQRPPWLEEAIPDQWDTIHDDGDLLVINKPSGLPVMPGGGFLEHTLTAFACHHWRQTGASAGPLYIGITGLCEDCSNQGGAVKTVPTTESLSEDLSSVGASGGGVGARPKLGGE